MPCFLEFHPLLSPLCHNTKPTTISAFYLQAPLFLLPPKSDLQVVVSAFISWCPITLLGFAGGHRRPHRLEPPPMLPENRSSGAEAAWDFRKPKIPVRCRNGHKNRPHRTVYCPTYILILL